MFPRLHTDGAHGLSLHTSDCACAKYGQRMRNFQKCFGPLGDHEIASKKRAASSSSAGTIEIASFCSNSCVLLEGESTSSWEEMCLTHTMVEGKVIYGY